MVARLCLNMIVRNEAKILERCLASVAPWISCYAIADTGSTDGTPDLIRKFFAERGTPGVVQEGVPFEDFSQARNAALAIARGTDFEFEYMLLTDADMELIVEERDGEDFRAKLSAPAYMVTQATNITYGNTRLVQRQLPCHYVEPTHEYLSTGLGTPPLLDGVWFRDWAEGSSRSEKTERDLRLLRGALEKNPHNARAHFYLAQTYKDLGRHLRAIDHYQKRIALGGFPEEVWYTQYMIATCERELGHENEFVLAALKAFEMRPHRAEPLFLLAHYYRERGRNDLAVLYARHGALLPPPEEDILFVESFVYDHGFREEISISGYYSALSPVQKEAERACYDLALDAHAPHGTRDVAYRNIIHYAKPLREHCPSAHARPIVGLVPPESGLYPMNPSVTRAPDGRLLCNVRWVNYTSEQAKRSTWPAVVRTENQIGELDLDSNELRSPRRVVEREVFVPLAANNPAVVGFEDLRIFTWRDRLWATATVRDRNPHWTCEIMRLGLEPREDVYEIVSEKILAPRQDVPADRHQKNWVPLVDGSDLDFVYETDPTTILRADPETRATSGLVEPELPPFACESFRGSSQAIPFSHASEDGFLYLIHEVFHHYGAHRCYTHRFVWLDHARRVRAVSDPFFFVKKTIEFAVGLTLLGDTLVASFGLEDGEAWFVTVDADEVRATLRAPPEE